MNLQICTVHFKGTKAETRGHGGNRLRCLREVSGLHIVVLTHVTRGDCATFTIFVVNNAALPKMRTSLNKAQ